MRVIPPSTRAAIEQPSAPIALLAFMTIRHRNLSEPIRVVSDVLDYQWGGDLYTGIVFGFSVVTDNEEQPTAQITMQNVDRRIGQALRRVSDRASIHLAVLSSADFDLTAIPRVPLATPAVIYQFANYELQSVTVDVSQVTGSVGLRDFGQESWPGIYATQARLPALYR